jgi:putative intracellular protease/amidase
MPATKTIHLAVYDTYADWECAFAVAHLNQSDWQRRPGQFRVATVAETAEPVTSMGGLRVSPDVVLADLRPDDSAMLILPGASTWLTGGNAAFADAARRFLDAGVPVAAICGATGGLAVAGLLDARDHTSNAPEYLAGLGYAGGDRYRDEPAVTDGDLITASATAPVEFAREIFARLDVYEPGVLASWYQLYGEHDPAGYFGLVGAES